MATQDQTLAALIARARDASAALADRHEAFAGIVRRFEDLALACACARLRDRALAEDAAQDAFVVAWERLDQLRDPAAFPGWIRRLVLTQCHRRLRSARLTLVADEETAALAAVDPALDVEAAHDAAIIRLALAQLTPADRLALSLFYGSERSHKEIAGWLGVPATTVARRLAHAKRRLQKHALDVLSGALRTQRKASGETFLIELSARLRRADAGDAGAIRSLATRLNVERARRFRDGTQVCAYIVEDPSSRAPIAYAAATRTIFAPIYDLRLAIGADAIRRHAGDVLVMQIVEDLTARGAICLQHRAAAHHREIVHFLRTRGFAVTRRQQDWRLDVVSVHAGPEGPAHKGGREVAWRADRGAASPEAFEFRSLADAAASPKLFDDALRLISGVMADDPEAWPFLPLHPDTLRRALRAQRAGAIAMAEGTVHGLIGASDDDLLPNACRINLLTVAADRRRQGVATALLNRLLSERRCAFVRLVASSRSDLTGWLTRCRFTQASDALLLERLLRRTVRVAPERLDEYVGSYVVQDRAMPPILIERHGESLVSKARDMRDILLPSSESEFFTRHHYGEGRFERDDSGRVTRLVVSEPPHAFEAVRSETGTTTQAAQSWSR